MCEAIASKRRQVGVCLPCYNEVDNVVPMVEELLALFASELPDYELTVLFIDNCSTDGTTEKLRDLCHSNDNVCAIVNARNFSHASVWHGIANTPGDCVISIPSDFQVPLEVIPQLIRKWEFGHDVVCLIKTSSKERRKMWLIRQLYYRLSRALSEQETLPNFTGGLYDRSFIERVLAIDDPLISNSLRSCIVDLALNMDRVEYVQQERRSGTSKNSVHDLCRIALNRYTETSYSAPYTLFIAGIVLTGLCVIMLVCYTVVCIASPSLTLDVVTMLLIMLAGFVAGQFIGLGILGEYLIKMHRRLLRRPSVIEAERINLGD